MIRELQEGGGFFASGSQADRCASPSFGCIRTDLSALLVGSNSIGFAMEACDKRTFVLDVQRPLFAMYESRRTRYPSTRESDASSDAQDVPFASHHRSSSEKGNRNEFCSPSKDVARQTSCLVPLIDEPSSFSSCFRDEFHAWYEPLRDLKSRGRKTYDFAHASLRSLPLRDATYDVSKTKACLSSL